MTNFQLKDRCKLCTYLQILAKKMCYKICPPKTHPFVQLLEEELKSTKVPKEWWKKDHPVRRGSEIRKYK